MRVGRERVVTVLMWFFLLLVLWLLLTGGEAWLSGAVVALAGTVLGASMGQQGPRRLRPWATLRFLLFFLHRSLAGGADVAWRALHPRMPLKPGWLDYTLRLQHPGAQALFIGAVSLTPGTLGADITGDRVRIHSILDDVEPDLRRLESLIAAVFGETGEGA